MALIFCRHEICHCIAGEELFYSSHNMPYCKFSLISHNITNCTSEIDSVVFRIEIAAKYIYIVVEYRKF